MRMSEEEYRQFIQRRDGTIHKESKYHAKKIEINGMKFDSKREATRWVELKYMQRAGEIHNLQRQVRYELIPKQDGEKACYYVADFVYKDKQGNTVVEDAKGVINAVYVIKRKLMLMKYGIKIKEV